MCGIGGMINTLKKPLGVRLSTDCKEMLINCEERGNDAFGYMTNSKVFKVEGSVTEFIEKNGKDPILNEFKKSNFVLYHTRKMTSGLPSVNHNNHPFETKDLVFAHNGIIYNDSLLKNQHKFEYDIETDSFIIPVLIQHHMDKGLIIEEAMKKTFEQVSGSYACWLHYKPKKRTFLFRHGNPLVIGYIPAKNLMLFASESNHFKFMEKYMGLHLNFFAEEMIAYTLKENHVYEFKDGEMIGFDFTPFIETYSTSPRGRNWSYNSFGELNDTCPHHQPITLIANQSDLSILQEMFDDDEMNVLKEDGLKIEQKKKDRYYVRIPLKLRESMRVCGYESNQEGCLRVKGKIFKKFLEVLYTNYKSHEHEYWHDDLTAEGISNVFPDVASDDILGEECIKEKYQEEEEE